MADFSRFVSTTIDNYVKGAIPNVTRKRPLMGLLKKNGRIKNNESGLNYTWRVEYKENTLQAIGDMDQPDYNREDYWQVATLPVRAYIATNAISWLEILKNKGQQAIIKLLPELTDKTLRDMMNRFSAKLFVDGNAAATIKDIHGLESFFGVSGASSTGLVGTNNDTYAGLSTALADKGGTWTPATGTTGTWPDGTGDAEFDYWTPLVLDYTDSAWGTAADTWAEGAYVHLRYAILWSQRNAAPEDGIDLAILTMRMYRELLNILSVKEDINIRRGEGLKLVSMGFRDVVEVDGCEVTWDFDCPGSTGGGSNDVGAGYGISLNHCSICSWQEDLFKADQVVFKEDNRTKRIGITFAGNARFNPRRMCKFSQIT